MATDKPLPVRLDAERMILGAIILNNEVIDQAIEGLGQGDTEKASRRFFDWSNRQVFRAMTKMHSEGLAIDPLTLQERLQQAGALDKVGGPAYIALLFDGVPRFSNIENYVASVRESAILREQINLGNWLVNVAWADDAESAEIARLLNAKLDDMLNAQVRHELISGATAADRVLQRLEEVWENPVETLGLKTGYGPLDKAIYGLRPRFHILAAPPKVGKTTFALNLAHNVIKENKGPGGAPVVLFLSLEMTVDELTERALAAFARVPLDELLTGSLGADEKRRVREAKNQIAQMPIEYLEGFDSVTPATIKALIRKVKRIHKRIDLLVVDYIQLCDADGHTDNDTARVSRITREFKRISKAFDLPVLGLSQVNRKFADRSDAKLRLTDLRQSGALEQDADVVIFIQRENPHDLSDTRRVLDIAAQRGGKSDVQIPMIFIGERSRFEVADMSAYREFEREPAHASNGNGNGNGKKPKKQGKPVNGLDGQNWRDFVEDAGW
jgi:replicative DNA helicase